MTIKDKQELIDYINKGSDYSRIFDPIQSITFFAHGTAFDQHGNDDIENPGYENNYAIAMGYSHKKGVNHKNDLNIFVSDLSKINSWAFAKNSCSYFGSCRTGNLFNNVSFAQEWANMTGGLVSASTGTDANNGRTYYGNIYEEGLGYKILGRLGLSTPREKARKKIGYFESGCYYYPEVTDGGKFKVFRPN